MKKALSSCVWLIVILALPLGCATRQYSPPPLPRVLFSTPPEMDANQTAIVHHDERAYVQISGSRMSTESVVFRPGKQTLLIQYHWDSGLYREYAKEPLRIETTLEAGHEYQVVCYKTFGAFSVVIVDITTDDGVMGYLKKATEPYQRERAVKLLRSQSHLKDLALQYPAVPVRKLAVSRLGSREVLGQVIENDIDSDVRKEAEKRLRQLAASPASGISSEGRPAMGPDGN